jgi:type IV pilus assembly protein PilM
MLFKHAFTGIDIREKDICIATIVMEKVGPVIKMLTQIPTHEEWYEGGRVRDLKELSSVLNKSKQDSKKWSKLVHIAVPTQHVILRKIDSLPDLPEKELARLIHFEIGESIHLPFDQPIYDFVMVGSIEEKRNMGGDSFDTLAEQAELEEGMRSNSNVLFIATSKKLAEDLHSCVKQASLKPLTAEIRATALQRLILTLHPDWFKETEAILNISEDSTDLHIFNQGVLEFTRNIAISKSSFMLDNQFASFDHEVAATVEASETVQAWDENSYLDDLMNEVGRAQNFYRYTLNQGKQEFRQLILTGGFSDSLYAKLSDRLPYTVTRINFNPLLSEEFEEKSLLDCNSVAIGLALRGKETTKKKKATKDR